jgi:RpiB/LacA/LacB family sugar-phosphate isomerase
MVERLRAQGHEVIEFGATSDAACDYPEFAAAVANAVRADAASVGMLFCATGHGMAMAAGKVRGIRAFAPTSVEAARLSRFDNNSNVLCLGGRTVPDSEAFAIAETWLQTGFAGGRHARRISRVAAMETAAAIGFVTESEELRLAALGVPGRVWERDPAVFTGERSAHAAIRNRLGWLALPDDMEANIADMAAFADEVRRAGFRRAVVLGTGGSSLCAEVLARVFGPAPGWLNVFVLDSTDPAAVAAVESSIDLDRTLFVLASSGDSIAVRAFERYFWAKVLQRCGGDAERAGQHFVAITAPGTPLGERARASSVRRVFLCPAELGARYSALTAFGLVPAALMGMDLGKLLARARRMANACREPLGARNPGAALGALLGSLAKHGRDKLTLLVAPEVAPLGAWIEQMVAESTGKQGLGIVPVDGEAASDPGRYHPDRVFVVVRLRGREPPAPADLIEAVTLAGHPVVEIELGDKYDLGAEIFRWQFAAMVAGIVLRVDPLDEPDVAATQLATGRVLSEETPAAPAAAGVPPADPAVLAHMRSSAPGDYLAICAFLHPTLERERLLHQLRLLCRDRLGVATTLGFGPRYLHSTGQLHKGGPASGIILHLAAATPASADRAVPGEPFTFGRLSDAQARAELQVLAERRRRVLRVELGEDPDAGLRGLLAALDVPSG